MIRTGTTPIRYEHFLCHAAVTGRRPVRIHVDDLERYLGTIRGACSWRFWWH